MYVIGIESSCDDTGIAAYDGYSESLISSLVYTKSETHAQFGGVVPELASRDHAQKIMPLFQQVLEQAKWQLNQIEAIAYTKGPGLAGSLLVGSGFAKSLSWILGIPAVAIHHLEGHIVSPFIELRPVFPFLALLVSGGHTQLYRVGDWFCYDLIGQSRDDAAGEAFDKCAKLLGLGYPGGKHLSMCAEKGDSSAFDFPRPMIHKGLDFSFSGLKTSVLYKVRELEKNGAIHEQTKCDLAASIEQAIVDILLSKMARAIQQTAIQQCIVIGGVSANSRLRKEAAKLSADVLFPSLELSTDNGAMIAFAGYKRMHAGYMDHDLAIEPRPRWRLDDIKPIC